MLEAGLHGDNAFATLTYRDKHGPVHPAMPNHLVQRTLVPRDAQLFLKRYRDKIAPLKLRFFLVGEYGDETERPHYHVLFFGIPGCSTPDPITNCTRYSRRGFQCCDNCALLLSAWKHGNAYFNSGGITPELAAYISGYTTKKMTRADDERLDGRYPEFARMSRNPGLGSDAMHEVGSVFLATRGPDDAVPSALRTGGRHLPLGRTLGSRLRAIVGRAERDGDRQVQLQRMRIETKVQAMRQLEKVGAPEEALPEIIKNKTAFKNAIIDSNQNYVGKVRFFNQAKKRGI